MKTRARMIPHESDQTLLDRTVALAKQTGRFGWQTLHAALDSSPLLGAGRVQDTWNLIGRALATVATCGAKAVGRPRAAVLRGAGITLLAAPSLKAALDIERSLARFDRIQGGRPRYNGARKNTLDVRRCAAVANLEQTARLKTAA